MKRSAHLRLFLGTAILTSAALTAAARADSYDAMSQAVMTTLHEPSYHLSMTMAGQATEADVVAPDRMHMTMPTGESTVIGKTMYMKMNGVWKKYDGVDLMTSPLDEMKKLAAQRAVTTVDDLGMRPVDGGVMHAYKVTNTQKKTTVTVYIDNAGRIAREEIGNNVIRLSKFGEAVSIKAPM